MSRRAARRTAFVLQQVLHTLTAPSDLAVAASTLASRSGRLRHEVELVSVSTDLRVVRETVQPTHKSLWLR